MSDRSHKRSRSYFNVFTVVDAEPQPSKPTEQQLQEIRVQQLRGHRKSNSATLTIPGSVKFSVTGDTPNKQPELAFTGVSSSSIANTTTMARPRSPQKKHDTSSDKMELLLDQKLLAIRQQLVSVRLHGAGRTSCVQLNYYILGDSLS